MNIAVIGSRGFQNLEFVKKIVGEFEEGTVVISGGALGVDTAAAEAARSKRLVRKIFYPDWQRYGRRAGLERNHDIVKNSDMVIAFWDQKSKGTAHSISLAKKYGKVLVVFNEKGEQIPV